MDLLTICIPTFRRVAMLRESLEQLLPEAEVAGVKIFVCDNASGDGTAEYLAETKHRHGCLDYRVNAATVPIDENMFLAMTWPSSRYIFPLGDDDCLPPGSLAQIIELLKSSPDVVLLRFKIVDAALRAKDFAFPARVPGMVFEDPREAFGELWELFHFGAFVVRNELREDCFRRYFGTGHAYSGVVWDMLAKKYADEGRTSVLCSRQELVLIRDAGKTWSDYRVQIIYQGIPRWFELLHNFYKDKAVVARNSYCEQRATWRALIKMRKNGRLTHANLTSFEYFYKVYRYRMLVISLMPQLIAGILYRFIKSINPRRKVT